MTTSTNTKSSPMRWLGWVVGGLLAKKHVIDPIRDKKSQQGT